MAIKTTAPTVTAPATAPPVANSREFPMVMYHLKKGAKKVSDSIDKAAHEALGYTTTPPAPAEEKE